MSGMPRTSSIYRVQGMRMAWLLAVRPMPTISPMMKLPVMDMTAMNREPDRPPRP